MRTSRGVSRFRSLGLGALASLAACDPGPSVGRDLEPPDLGPGPCVDVPAIRLGSARVRSVRPGMAWNGAHFGIAYAEGDDADGEVIFETRSPTGEPRSAPVTLSAGGAAMSPRVVAAGTGFGLVWYDPDDDRDIFFRRVDAEGRPDGPVVNVSESPGWSYAADVEYRDGQFAVTWLDDSEGGLQTWFRVLDDAGAGLGPARVLSRGAERAARPAVAATAAGYAVAWTQWPDGRDPVYLALLDSAGAADELVVLTEDDGPASHPALVATDDGFLVAWDDGQGGGRVMGRDVDPQGRPRGAPFGLAGDAPRATMPSLARAADGRIGLLWSDARADAEGLDLWFRVLDAHGRPETPPLRVGDLAGDDLQGVLARDETGFGVVWFASDGGDEHVYFAHVRLECGPGAAP